MTIRLKAVVEYDGTEYAGFQLQPSKRTVQGVLEETLKGLTGVGTRITGAGRTDAGVHAEGQVVAFHTDWRHSLHKLHRGMNALLPRDIAVRSLEQVADDFHPRFDAKRRCYRYTIWNHTFRSPLHERFTCHVGRPLDIAAMGAATAGLIGIQDFATFGLPTQGESTMREVMELTWERAPEEDFIQMSIVANAFLRNMVRCIVGSALLVGTGEWAVGEFTARFHARERSQSGPPAPPQGLCLVGVEY